VQHGNDLGGTSDVAEKFPERVATKVISGKNVTGYFTEDFTWAEISTLRLRARAYGGQGALDGIYPFFRFSEMLEFTKTLARETNRWGELGVYPELKMPTYFRSLGLPLEEKYLQAAADAGYCTFDEAGFCASTTNGEAPGPFIAQSFYSAPLKYIQSHSEFQRVVLITSVVPRGPDKIKTAAQAEAYAKYADIVALPISWGAENFTRATLLAQAAGLEVHGWTTDVDPAPYRMLVDLGVTATFSNNANFADGVLQQMRQPQSEPDDDDAPCGDVPTEGSTGVPHHHGTGIAIGMVIGGVLGVLVGAGPVQVLRARYNSNRYHDIEE
jgi:glycerophosphoryl diester phosphodiesterase